MFLHTRKHLLNNGTRKVKRDVFGYHNVLATPIQRVFSALGPTYGMAVALDEIRDLAYVQY